MSGFGLRPAVPKVDAARMVESFVESARWEVDRGTLHIVERNGVPQMVRVTFGEEVDRLLRNQVAWLNAQRRKAERHPYRAEFPEMEDEIVWCRAVAELLKAERRRRRREETE